MNYTKHASLCQYNATIPRNKGKNGSPIVQMLDGSDNDALLECMIAMLVQHDDKMFHVQWNGAYDSMH